MATIRETKWGRMYLGARIRQIGGGRRELYYTDRATAERAASEISRDPAQVECSGPDAILDVESDGSARWIEWPGR